MKTETINRSNSQVSTARKANQIVAQLVPTEVKVRGKKFNPVQVASRRVKRNIASGNLPADMSVATRVGLTIQEVANLRNGNLPRRSQMIDAK